MEIITTYIGTLDGVNGIWCGFKPEGSIITEEKLVLRASAGYKLKNKETEETYYSVIIQNEDEQENFEEIKDEDFPIKPKKEDKDA